MGGFDISPELAEEWRGKYRSSVEPHVDGEVLAGGLPGQFVLAVTPDKLYAFKYKSGRNGVTIKDEVASWDRAGGLALSVRQTTTRLTLEFPDGEKIVCDQEGLGDNPWADDVIQVLTRN
jgi:hypothetical protein